MINLEQTHKYAEEIERRLRLQSFPLAIKLLKKEADIPEGAIRPKRDLGYHLALCQAFQMSRRDGQMIAMLKEDMWCFEPVVGYGLAEPPQYFLDGYTRFPEEAETLEAGKNFAKEFPHLETGKYIGIVSAPLAKTSFEPDVAVVYCNPGQLTILLGGREFKDGHNLPTVLSPNAVCVHAIVPVIQNRRYQVSIPCCGDRGFAAAADDELVCTVPIEKLEDLMFGLRQHEEFGTRFPILRSTGPEPQLPESYIAAGKAVGLDVN